MENSYILKNNRLIAKFIGGKFNGESRIRLDPQDVWLPKFGVCRHDTIELGKGKTLQFHKSWEWLMRAIEKIENLNHSYFVHFPHVLIETGRVRIMGRYKTKDPNKGGFDMGNWIGETPNYQYNNKLDALYGCVVEFIKVYNQELWKN